jgi:hypothetical protein
MTAFTVAPSSERALDLGAYLLGMAELALILGALAYAGWRVRRTILPGWGGAPARLAESVLALAALVWVAQALGTFGAYTELAMLISCPVLAAVCAVVCGRLDSRTPARAAAPEPPAPAADPIAIWLAAGICAAVAAAWMVPTLASLAGGMDRADTLWYHMPLAVRYAETGELGSIDYFDPIFFASYYPANSELLHSVGVLAFDRDIASPLLNLGFLLLGMLAAYCVGRPYGLGPQSLIGGSIALGSQSLAEFQAGEALNDIVGVALILAAAAILVNARAASLATPKGGRGEPDTGIPKFSGDMSPENWGSRWPGCPASRPTRSVSQEAASSAPVGGGRAARPAASGSRSAESSRRSSSGSSRGSAGPSTARPSPAAAAQRARAGWSSVSRGIGTNRLGTPSAISSWKAL